MNPKLLLIWPYGIIGAESIPISFSFLAAQTKKIIETTILDCSIYGLHPRSETFKEYLLSTSPNIIGISSWSQNWRWVERTIFIIRDILPDVVIVVGGPHVTATSQLGGANYGLTGECEHTFPELIKALLSGASAESIQGIRRINGKNDSGFAKIQDLDALGLPDFDAMLLRAYQENGYKYRTGVIKQAPILATRGCPYECAFCIQGDQEILMADNTRKTIRNVVVGDMVMGYDEHTFQFVPTRVSAVHDNGIRETVFINAGGVSIECTPDHKFLAWTAKTRNVTSTWLPVGRLEGAYVKNRKGQYVLINDVQPGLASHVYDLTTDMHNYIAQGFVVHNCEAPILSGRKIRKHSIAYLKELVFHLRDHYDVKHVNIVDDNFTFYPAYAKEFCEMVLQNRDKLGGMTFSTPNGIRVERSDKEMFKMMKAAGWSRVIFAPESGSQRMVDIMAKHLDLNVVPERVEWAHEAGLEVEAFFIMNYPGETDADVDETEKFLRAVPFDSISMHLFKPLPHTPIWRELVDSGKIEPDHLVGRYNEVDWLANGRTVEDISAHAIKYTTAAKYVTRIA